MVKKIILNVFLLVASLFLLDFFLGYLLDKFYFKEKSGVHYETTFVMDSTRADVLVFGSSRANHNYIPHIFEDSLKMSFYNTGRDDNGIFYQYAVLKSLLKRYSPKLIILDYAGGFESGQYAYERLSSLLPYYESHKEIREIVELKSTFEKVKLLSKVYPYNSLLLTIAMGNLKDKESNKKSQNGYIPITGVWDRELDSIDFFTTGNLISKKILRPNDKKWGDPLDSIKTFAIDSTKLKFFKEFITNCKNSGTQIVVIYSPVFQKYKFCQEVDICKKVCDQEKIKFWDLSQDSVFLKNRMFFQDLVHLNDKGATVYSQIVAHRLKKEIL